jgi:cyclic pyranopterin phosphate synthase
MLPGLYDIDEADPSLSLVPLAARRALDRAGRKLSLPGWTSLHGADRRGLVERGTDDEVDIVAVREIAERATPPADEIEPSGDPNPARPPAAVLEALGPKRLLSDERWRALRPLDRWTFVKLAFGGKHERLAALHEELTRKPTHLDAQGNASMVSVAEKTPTARRAVASAKILLAQATIATIAAGGATKGDVFGVARIAGIQAAKRTHELIPLCHAIALTRVEVVFHVGVGEILVQATSEAIDRTGVEMEAMTAATVAALTIYDMVKSIDRWMTITDVRLESKEGGRSGTLVRP